MEILRELQVFNRIVFLDKSHTYHIDNKPSAPFSVTKLLEQYKEPFDKDKWAQIKAKELGLTPKEVLDSWELKSTYSKVLGTVFHKYAENYYSNKVVPYDKEWVQSVLPHSYHTELRETLQSLLTQFNKFYNDTRNYLIPVKNELVIGDIDKTRVCGTIDMLCYNTKKSCYELYDFKTNKEINHTNKYKKKYLPPLDHLEACEVNTYSLQLGIYKKFLEDYTTIKIEGLYVVWLNKNNPTYNTIPLLDLSQEVNLIFQKLADKQVQSNP